MSLTAVSPPGANDHGMLSRRLDFSTRGLVVAHSGKVEIGQGVLTALVRIAAATLGLDTSQIVTPAASTDGSPDEGPTAGSLSIQVGGAAVRQACLQARALMTEACARRLGADADRLTIVAGEFRLDGKATGLTYWDLGAALDGVAAEAADPSRPLSVPLPETRRVDLAAKILGGGFIHDLELPGMLHARVVRPSRPGARLDGIDLADFSRNHPQLKVVRDGDFLGVVGAREDDVARAADDLFEICQWRAPPDPTEDLKAVFQRAEQAPTPLEARRGETGDGTTYSAAYSRPGIAHGSLGPSCAVAMIEDGVLKVWSHSQNIFVLRDALARTLDLEPGAVVVIHAQGSGCYGHNGADDVAFDAARLALETDGAPVRVQWSRADELRWSPVGAPGMVRIESRLDSKGKVAEWRLELWTAPHSRRPYMGGPNLLGATMLARPTPLAPAAEVPQPMGGGDRNALSTYDFPVETVIRRFAADFPVRTSALRSLGAHLNIFAIESFMDELAAHAGADPVEFRLRHLSDARSRAVVERASALSGWGSGEEVAGRAKGFAFARYKNTSGFAAVVVEVDVGDEVATPRAWCVADVGSVVSADGVRNQIEGGIVQSLSWAIKEDARLTPAGVGVNSWEEYPIARFSDAPRMAIELIDAPHEPPLGSGEIVQGPATAAVANGLARALGQRVRDLPLSRERIIAAITGA